jgi:iron complex transport system permease protein
VQAAPERNLGAAAPPGRRGHWPVFACLCGALLGAMLLSLGMGEVAIGPAAVAGILLRHLGWTGAGSFDPIQDGVLWTLRLPRVLLGALVGGSLALAGATLQGLLRNPLADPALLGSSSGAALGTVLLLLIGGPALGLAALLPAACCGSLLATGAVYLLALHQGRTDVLTMVLAGVVVNALVAGVVGLLIAATNNAALNSITYWELGSLAGANWDDVAVLAPLTLGALLFLLRWTQALNLLAIGDRDARYLGVDVTRARAILLVVVSLLTAATVAVAGIVAFVGLVVPHLLRLVLGPDHTALVPASALGGAVLVVLIDLLARTLAAPAEIPLGSLTAILGCPFLLWLLRRGHVLHGRWA